MTKKSLNDLSPELRRIVLLAQGNDVSPDFYSDKFELLESLAKDVSIPEFVQDVLHSRFIHERFLPLANFINRTATM